MNETVEHIPVVRSRTSLVTALSLTASVLMACTIPVKEIVPEGSAPMSAADLFKIYRNKTWVWQNGAGRFYVEERRFLAWVSQEAGEGYGEGHYLLSDDGELCIKATWADAAGAADDTMCFVHRSVGETIYQKRVGSGEWYVFKHEEAAPSDEYNKLVSGDDVTERVARIKSALARE